MAKRILMVVLADERAADDRALARCAAEAARASGGIVRMMYVAPVPAPRRDRYDRVVAGSEREIERITEIARARLSRLAWDLDGVPVEPVVRFGQIAREVAIEAELFDADLVALAEPYRPGLRRFAFTSYLAWLLAPRAAVASALSDPDIDPLLILATLRPNP